MGGAGTLYTQTETESSHRKRKAGTYMGKKKPREQAGLCGSLKDVFPQEQWQATGVLQAAWCGKKAHSGCGSKTCLSWLLKNNLHFKSSVPSLYLRFWVCICFCWNIFRSCVLHFYLGGWLTVHTLGSIRAKPQLACNLEIQGLLYADFK